MHKNSLKFSDRRFTSVLEIRLQATDELEKFDCEAIFNSSG